MEDCQRTPMTVEEVVMKKDKEPNKRKILTEEELAPIVEWVNNGPHQIIKTRVAALINDFRYCRSRILRGDCDD